MPITQTTANELYGRIDADLEALKTIENMRCFMTWDMSTFDTFSTGDNWTPELETCADEFRQANGELYGAYQRAKEALTRYRKELDRLMVEGK